MILPRDGHLGLLTDGQLTASDGHLDESEGCARRAHLASASRRPTMGDGGERRGRAEAAVPVTGFETLIYLPNRMGRASARAPLPARRRPIVNCNNCAAHLITGDQTIEPTLQLQ